LKNYLYFADWHRYTYKRFTTRWTAEDHSQNSWNVLCCGCRQA